MRRWVFEIAALEDESPSRRLLEQQLRTAWEAEADKRGRLDRPGQVLPRRSGCWTTSPERSRRTRRLRTCAWTTWTAATSTRTPPPESAPLSVHQGDAGPPSSAVEREITHLQELLATDSRDVEAQDRLRQLQRAVR